MIKACTSCFGHIRDAASCQSCSQAANYDAVCPLFRATIHGGFGTAVTSTGAVRYLAATRGGSRQAFRAQIFGTSCDAQSRRRILSACVPPRSVPPSSSVVDGCACMCWVGTRSRFLSVAPPHGRARPATAFALWHSSKRRLHTRGAASGSASSTSSMPVAGQLS